jgi:hypothetical protein
MGPARSPEPTACASSARCRATWRWSPTWHDRKAAMKRREHRCQFARRLATAAAGRLRRRAATTDDWAEGMAPSSGTATPACVAAWRSPTAVSRPSCAAARRTRFKFDDIGCLVFWLEEGRERFPWMAEPATRCGSRSSTARAATGWHDARRRTTWYPHLADGLQLRRRMPTPARTAASPSRKWRQTAAAWPNCGPKIRQMKQFWLTARLDIVESLRSRWFRSTPLVFGGIVALLFLFGLTESRVLGFIGLSRLLVTYIQLTMAILPIFVLITTVRSVAGDREAGVFEYLLSLPVSLGAWFWGKFVGRYLVIFLPVAAAMALAVASPTVQGHRGAVGRVRLLHRAAGGDGAVLPRLRHADLVDRAQHRHGAGRGLPGVAAAAAVPRPDPARRDDPGQASRPRSR